MWKKTKFKNMATAMRPGDLKFNTFKELWRAAMKDMLDAMELDEKVKSSSQDNLRQMLEAAEKYKSANSLYKKSRMVPLHECSVEQQREASRLMEKLSSCVKDAEDRILDLSTQLQAATGVAPAPPSIPPPSRPPASSNSIASSSQSQRQFRSTVPSSTVPASKRIVRTGRARPSPATPEGRRRLLEGVDSKIGEKLLDEVLSLTEVRLSDVAGCSSAKAALEEAVILPLENPDLFTGLRQPVKGILLFGPPGNGKTMLAKAIATESNQLFLNVSASTLTSKWVGEGEKGMRGLFQIARNGQPCIIFIDEIDSLLCSRSENEADHARRMKTEFLVQFDGATSKSEDRILVIGATNRPHDLDDAVLRRFSKRILVDLPDEKARHQLLVQLLRKFDLDRGLSDSDYRYIASRTDGFSNSDIVALCKEASMVPIRTMGREQLVKVSKHDLRPLKRSDFDKALSTVKPARNEKLLNALKNFALTSGSL